uniref:CS domain-containing protein n=1 Tax=Macrostomum lignano TaxID=282301 RepID=A0A1I8FV55_9PLAT
ADRQEQYDSLYLSILQREGTLPAFFDSLFSFLMRRTDYYYQLTENGPRDRGFPPGAAFDMVKQSFKKHEALFNSTVINKATGELAYSADPECYNGAARDGYSWSQSITELDIRVNVDRSLASKGSDVRVNVGRKSLRVDCRSGGGARDFSTVLDRQLSHEVRAEEAVWSLVPSDGVVQISLEKVQERWWDCCFTGEEKINTREIDCSRPMSDLDEEAQAKIDQMMFDQRQKQMGLPTSEEAKTLDLLRKAWDAEGSPFKGTPFDPSVISNQMPADLLKQQQQQQ